MNTLNGLITLMRHLINKYQLINHEIHQIYERVFKNAENRYERNVM